MRTDRLPNIMLFKNVPVTNHTKTLLNGFIRGILMKIKVDGTLMLKDKE